MSAETPADYSEAEQSNGERGILVLKDVLNWEPIRPDTELFDYSYYDTLGLLQSSHALYGTDRYGIIAVQIGLLVDVNPLRAPGSTPICAVPPSCAMRGSNERREFAMSRRQSRRSNQQAGTLLIIVGMSAALAVMTATLVLVIVNVQANTADNRTRQKASGVGEAAIDAQMYQLAQGEKKRALWPVAPADTSARQWRPRPRPTPLTQLRLSAVFACTLTMTSTKTSS